MCNVHLGPAVDGKGTPIKIRSGLAPGPVGPRHQLNTGDQEHQPEFCAGGKRLFVTRDPAGK